MSRSHHRAGLSGARALARRGLLGLLTVSTAATICLVPTVPAFADTVPHAAVATAPTPSAATGSISPATAATPTPATPIAVPSAPSSAAATAAPTSTTVSSTSTAVSPSSAGAPPASTSAAPTSTSSDAAPSTTSPTTTSPIISPTSTNPSSSAPASTFSLSAAAANFLSALQINVGSGPVTGTLTGSVLTVAVGAPAIPFQLPVAGQTVTFAGATLAIDESARTLTLSASVAASDGLGGTLTVTIAHADTTTLSGTDLTGTLAITGIGVLGTTVNVAGTLAYVGGKLSASLTGTLAADAVLAGNAFTVKSGSTITLSTDTGLSVTGTAVLGSGSAAFTVDVSGAISDSKNWSLTVADTTDTPTFSPIDGLTINPAFSGSISDAAGTVTFDVAGSDTGSWAVGGATVSLHHIEVSNGAVPSGVTCPAADPGQVWFDIQGGLDDPAAGISGTAEACIDPAAHAFDLTVAAPTITLPQVPNASLSMPSVSITGTKLGTASATVAVTASATLTVTPDATHTVVLPVTLAFASDGSFTASAGVDLGQLGLGASGSSGTLVLASKQIKQFDPTTVAATGDPFDLPAGVTVLLAYQPSGAVSTALQNLHLPVPANLVARASLGTTGFSGAVSIDFGTQAQGAKLFAENTPGGAAAYVDNVTLGFALGASTGTITVSGSAYLVLPQLYPSGSGSQVEVTLGGSLGVTAEGAVTVSLQFDIAGVNGPWTDAFGIPGLSVSEVAGKIGVEDSAETAGIPLPTLSFLVSNLQLPKVWSDAIGIQMGAGVSLNLAFDVDNPILGVSITGPTPTAVALEPFQVVQTVAGSAIPSSFVDSVQVNTAQLLFAPFGGTDASGVAISPGATLVFDSTISGVGVHVDGAVGVLPYPSLTADASITSFSVGPVSLSNPDLKIDLSADPSNPVADVSFSGGFTDSTTGISFTAGFDLGASTSLANAGVSLHIAGGQPKYLAASADLAGSVSVSSTGVSFSPSGNASVTVAGQNLGSVPFSYSTTGGALWQQLQGSIYQVTQAFRTAYGWTDAQAATALTALHEASNQVAYALQYAYNDAANAVLAALVSAGYGVDTAISTVQNYLSATDAQVAAGLNQLHYQANQVAQYLNWYFGDADARVTAVLTGLGDTATSIANTLSSVFGDTDRQVAAAFQQAGLNQATIEAALANAFGDGQAAVYNALTSIGSAGSSALDALSSVFNSGAYSPSTHPWWSVPLLADVSGGSTAPGAGVLQWTWNGGHNQQWYLLPTDGGFAEIVNRNSGQCLAAPGYGAGQQLIQTPCTGGPLQQWYLDIYPGQSIQGQTEAIWNRATGLYADVSGASTSAGASIDQWYYNGNWNQQWYFGPAVG